LLNIYDISTHDSGCNLKKCSKKGKDIIDLVLNFVENGT